MYAWIIPQWVYYKEGGYYHFNASEDTNFRNRLEKRRLVRYCETVIGENWKVKGNEERRFVKSRLHILWRVMTNYKDNIRARDDLTIKMRIKKKFKV